MTEKFALEIRRAGDDDLPALYDFVQRDLKQEKNSGYFERCLQLQFKDKRILWVCTHGASIMAYAILNWEPKYGFYKRLNIPEIQDLNVAIEARQKGIATKMIEHCEARAREKGYSEMGISYGLHSSYGPAQRLYTKLGYIPDGNGATYDRKIVSYGASKPMDDDLCLMLVKYLT